MEQSPELADLTVRLYEALSKGDHAFFERSLSLDKDVLLIGTDPAEWWVGHDTIARIVRAQLEEMGGGMTITGKPQAFSDGGVGWVIDQPRWSFPGGQEMALRATLVFRKEDGGWKLAVWHASLGVRNEDLLGKSLTTR